MLTTLKMSKNCIRITQQVSITTSIITLHTNNNIFKSVLTIYDNTYLYVHKKSLILTYNACFSNATITMTVANSLPAQNWSLYTEKPVLKISHVLIQKLSDIY